MAYKMTHPASSLEIKVDASQVAMYESQGWETAATAPKPPAEKPEQ